MSGSVVGGGLFFHGLLGVSVFGVSEAGGWSFVLFSGVPFTAPLLAAYDPDAQLSHAEPARWIPHAWHSQPATGGS
jgi:hypothetical protein